jgi:hypothetical protein
MNRPGERARTALSYIAKIDSERWRSLNSLVNDELLWANQTESSLAIHHWRGVSKTIIVK